ncbi:MAG: HD domain-containing protein [Myxococcales bacterium]|nr:HD domain-containing protein [Myxococcales bacterium]
MTQDSASAVSTRFDGLELAERELPALLAEVRAELSDDPGHDLHHALRVAAWTLRISAGEVSERVALAAALLHDVVNLPKDSPERALASEMSAARASRVLPRHGFSEAETALVAEAIRDHSFSRGAVPTSPLGRALQDADRLEALGALGLMRCISTGTRMGARYFHAEDVWAEQRPLDDLGYSIDHFFTKLLALPQTMTTELGRREAERRVEFLRTFLEELASELGTPLPPGRC